MFVQQFNYFSGHHRFLFENGIRHSVSLMKQRPRGAMESVQLPKLNRLKIRIEDNCAPTLYQIKQFLRIVEDANDKREVMFGAVCCKRLNESNESFFKLRASKSWSSQSPESIANFFRIVRILALSMSARCWKRSCSSNISLKIVQKCDIPFQRCSYLIFVVFVKYTRYYISLCLSTP